MRSFGKTWRAFALVVVAALSLSMVGSAPVLAADPPQGPEGDAFYTPPSPLPEGGNGDVIWWRQLPGQLGARGYLVLYRSTSATGTPIAVSGRVLVPTAAWTGAGERPIVSVASGTRGIGDSCAPSKFQPDYEKPLFIDAMLRKGWAVAITDYEGLGTPGTHTYVVGQSEGRSVIDAVRAATRLPAAGLASGGPVAFSGYSQGGGGAAWAGELAPSYAPELDVVGITAGGTPADLTAVSQFLDGSIGFGFLLLSALGLDAAYPELDLPDYLNAKGRELYETQQGACVDAVFGYAFGHIADYTTSNPLAEPDWQARLAENELGTRAPEAPIYLFHGLGDEIIPLAQAQELRSRYCAAGVDVQWATFLGEHVTTLVFSAPDVLGYLGDRFAGKPVKSNC
ncbi:lipase family protein [Amycolatopsis sp. 195334CR]|uniref:lipase family protein n=1 Tax=Amycolatopsis sp. 195334CR TaxID=2814588 RepID=UPI001A8CF6A5|nr:lipase family protein [Amycolatopsis sp. 195334CR]MBN6039675.1 lipase [Amycolatopsis sp. 195334CR]